MQKDELSQGLRTASDKQPNFIIKHWRGDYSLGFSFWVIGVLVRLVAAISVVPITGLLVKLTPNSDAITLILINGLWAPLSLWQLVGIWRAAERHIRSGGKAIWARLAQAMLLLVLLGSGIAMITPAR